jgi:hypothetical protein
VKTTSPGRLPDAGADPEALIKEARRRQHRRWTAVGPAIVVLLAVAASVTVSVTGSGGHAPGRQHGRQVHPAARRRPRGGQLRLGGLVTRAA